MKIRGMIRRTPVTTATSLAAGKMVRPTFPSLKMPRNGIGKNICNSRRSMRTALRGFFQPVNGHIDGYLSRVPNGIRTYLADRVECGSDSTIRVYTNPERNFQK